MSDSGINEPESGREDGQQKRSWRRSKGGSEFPPTPERPGVQEEPEFGDGTLIQTPKSAPPRRTVAEILEENTQVRPSEGDTTLAVPSNLPRIPGVTLTREIGRGGMGVVYEGKQGYLDRRVAVKFLAQGSQTDEFIQRFQREAKILASLNHSNIVGCYQAGVAKDGRCFLVMEFIDGPTLGDWIEKNGALPADRAVEVCRQVAQALASAHGCGVIHRDVKPPNVLLKSVTGGNADPRFPYTPMLADLGLARAAVEVPTLVNITMQGLTAHGAVMGSPPTMAPEQFDAPDEVDFRTDIYGLGCVLFHCLTGKLAFPQGTLTRLISRKTSGKPPDPREMKGDVSPQLAAFVRDMLAPSRDDRPGSYEELLRRFEGPFEPGSSKKRRALTYGAAAAVLLTGAYFAIPGGGDAAPGTDSDLARADVDEQGADGLAPADTDGGDSIDTEVEPGGTPDRPSSDGEESLGGDEGLGFADPIELPFGQGLGGSKLGDLTSFDPEAQVEDESGAPLDSSGGPADDFPDLTSDGGEGDTGEEQSLEAEGDETVLFIPANLTTVQPEESLALLSERFGEPPLAGWEATVGDQERWFGPDDSRNGAEALLFEARGAAERWLPAPSWSLSGRMEFVRPTSDEEPRRLGVVIILEKDQAILLEQSFVDEQMRLSGSHAVPRADGGWTAGEEIPELSLGQLERKDYGAAAPVSFQVDWNGARLSVSWNLSGGESAVFELGYEELLVAGAPVRLGVQLENGAARLSEFVVVGR